jgi:nitroreductase/NAD-dependent dihydropyrimidine dehydrogenase PreA subunit
MVQCAIIVLCTEEAIGRKSMEIIQIDAAACNHDGLCVQACPVAVIEQVEGAVPRGAAGAADRCIRCGHCVAVCPTGALSNALTPAAGFLPMPGDLPTGDQTKALLTARRSVRGFRKAPVPRERLEQLLEVARRAPTASNSQKVSWVMIQAPDRLDRIRATTIDWLTLDPARAVYARAAEQGRDVVLRGATVLAVAYGPTDYAWTDVDCAIALTYMELYAASLGLGACWGGLVTMASRFTAGLAGELGVPEGTRVAGAMMLGIPRQKHFLIPPRNEVRVEWL